MKGRDVAFQTKETGLKGREVNREVKSIINTCIFFVIPTMAICTPETKRFNANATLKIN